MKHQVEVNFNRGVSFECVIQPACSTEVSRADAIRIAKMNGFRGKVKTVKVMEVK